MMWTGKDMVDKHTDLQNMQQALISTRHFKAFLQSILAILLPLQLYDIKFPKATRYAIGCHYLPKISEVIGKLLF